MKTTKNPLIMIIGIFAIGFIAALFFVSLLGEINKVDETVEHFFSLIREQKYYLKDPNITSVKNLEVFDTEGDFAQNCFLLELSLLEYYGLTDKPEYSIRLKRSNFWIPFFQNPKINVQVSLRRPFSVPKTIKWPAPIKDLFTVERQNGTWRITSVNLKNSPLFEKYKSLKPGTDINAYMSKTGNEVVINIKLNTKDLTIAEKRKLQFIFKRLGQLFD